MKLTDLILSEATEDENLKHLRLIIQIMSDELDRLKETLKNIPYGFGSRWFVSDIWEADNQGLNLEEFKKNLLNLQRQGKLTLVRADLVAAMDPDKVQRSETVAPGGVVFHFVESVK